MLISGDAGGDASAWCALAKTFVIGVDLNESKQARSSA